MKLKRDDFKVLVPSESVDSEGEGQSMSGVEPFEPEGGKGSGSGSGKDDDDDKKDDKGDSKSGDKKGDEKEKGEGEDGSGSGKSEDKKSPSGGKAPNVSSKVEKVSGKGIGATLTPEESAKLQEELGVPVEVPTAADADKIKEEAKRAMSKTSDASSGSKQAGTGKGLLRRAIAKLTQPQIDWKAALRKFIGKAMSTSEMYMGSRRHLHGGDYLFGEKWKFDALQNAVVAVDTSGSMGPEQIEMILSEIAGIIKAKKIRNTEVVYFDGDVQSVDTLTNSSAIFDLEKVKGGGGTNFKPPLRYMEDKFKKGKLDLAVFCTDGYNSDNPLPIPKFKNVFVWVILDNPEFKPPFGTLTCYISQNDLKKK